MKSPLEVIDDGVFSACEVRLRISSDDERIYRCEQPLRLLAGRRLTCLASSESRQYVIKIYPTRSRTKDEFKKEVSGYELLHQASMDIPGRIYYGPASGDINIVIYQYIDRAKMLSEVFSDRPSAKPAREKLRQFIELIIRLHGDGHIHEDPHLDNFLYKAEKLYVLDFGAVRKVTNESLLEANFGLFMAQFPPSWHLDEDCLGQYVEALHSHDPVAATSIMLAEIERQREWRERHVLKKIYRECSSYHVLSSLHGKMIIKRALVIESLIEMLSDPEHLFNGKAPLLKDGNSTTVGIISVAGKDIAVKRYNIKKMVHRIKRLAGESRASRSWRNAHRMQLRGIATAEPVAMFECLKGKMRGVSVFAMQHLAGVNSADFFRDTAVDDKDRRRVAGKMLEIIAELKRQRITHGDLKSTNFILGNKTFLIDLDAMRFHGHRSGFEKRHAQDVRRFRENWLGDERTEKLFDSLYEKYGLSESW